MEAGTAEELVIEPETAGATRAGDEHDRPRADDVYEVSEVAALPEFDRAVRRAAEACETPIALVTVVADDRHWIVSSVGLDVREMPPRLAFCAQATLDRERLIVPDARADVRFASSPLVTGKLGLRFYAGIPLFGANGQPLGVFCVLDTRPRRLTGEQLEELEGIAREVGIWLELRRVSSELRAAEQALLGQQAMHDAIVAAALDCIITIDAGGRVLEFNPAAERTFGYAREEVIGRTMSELIVPPRLRERHERAVARLLASREPRILNQRVELEAIRRDGSEFPIELTVTQLAAEPPLFSGHVRDISDRKRAEADQLRLAAIMHSTHDAVIGLDRDRLIQHWNDGAERLYGYQRAEIIGRGMETIVPREWHEDLFGMLDRVLAGERVERLETQRITKDGRRLDVAVTLSPIVDSGGQLLGVSSISRDISDRKRLEAKLRHDAEHDPLTGLVNRRVFETRLEALAAAREHLGTAGSVIFIDLDHFKLVNDSLGHRAGDELIRRIAETLRSGVRETDTVARLGGDEFAVLLSGCTSVRAVEVADELIARIAAEVATGNAGASAGIAAIDAGASAEDVMAAADMALYDAKTRGRRRAMVYNGQNSLTLRTVAEVRNSIAAGRLILHAQPIIELATGHVVQHELLVRMLDREGQLIAPNRFIPIAERFGLVEQIDRWVIQRAAELARRGRSVAVNVSAHTLGDRATLELLHTELRTGLPAGNLSFEITETAALSDIDVARDFAQPLTRLGCGFALDDFGTGYGSLMHLKRLPITALKIDMEFVQNLSRDSADRHIVQGLVGIARALGLITIAEGVENLETLELLRELDIDRAQGYYIGRPAQIDATETTAQAA